MTFPIAGSPHSCTKPTQSAQSALLPALPMNDLRRAPRNSIGKSSQASPAHSTSRPRNTPHVNPPFLVISVTYEASIDCPHTHFRQRSSFTCQQPIFSLLTNFRSMTRHQFPDRVQSRIPAVLFPVPPSCWTSHQPWPVAAALVEVC